MVTSVMAALVMVVVMGAAVMIEVAAVGKVYVVLSSGMNLGFQRARFSCFLIKRNVT